MSLNFKSNFKKISILMKEIDRLIAFFFLERKMKAKKPGKN